MSTREEPQSRDAEAAQMLQMLLQLRGADRAAYEETIRSLGLGPVAEALEQQLPPRDEVSSSGLDIAELTDAISKMKHRDSNSSLEGLKVGNDPHIKGVHITPTAGFCFKTKTAEGKKVFVNIVKHEAVGAPAMTKRLNAEGVEEEGLNVPMSVGPEHVESDKKGSPCSAYDVIVHPSVVQDCVMDGSGRQRDFVCQLGIQSVDQKYSLNLDRRYKLPKLDYMGETPVAQFVKDKTAIPTIQEVKAPTASPSNVRVSAAPPMQAPPEQELELMLYWCSLQDEGACGMSKEARLSTFLRLCSEESESLLDSAWMRRCAGSTASAEFIEPMHEPPESSSLPFVALLLVAEVGVHEAVPRDLAVQCSPFRVSLQCRGYRKGAAYLPTTVSPAHSYFKCSAVPGFVAKQRIEVVLGMDWRAYAADADAGSKPWLLAQALTSENNPYQSVHTEARSIAVEGLSDRLPEEKFHLNLPPNVDQYTGVPVEETELPEDRFHRKDASSSFLINQREQAKKDKWTKWEKEKADRKNDPNVEYVDMEDYRPGGKHGPPVLPSASTVASAGAAQTQELKRAAQVLANSETLRKSQQLLSSTVWTELLE